MGGERAAAAVGVVVVRHVGGECDGGAVGAVAAEPYLEVVADAGDVFAVDDVVFDVGEAGGEVAGEC